MKRGLHPKRWRKFNNNRTRKEYGSTLGQTKVRQPLLLFLERLGLRVGSYCLCEYIDMVARFLNVYLRKLGD